MKWAGGGFHGLRDSTRRTHILPGMAKLADITDITGLLHVYLHHTYQDASDKLF